MENPDPGEIIRTGLQLMSDSRWPFASLALETLQFLKARSDPLYQVHCVSVRDSTEQRWDFTFFLMKENDQWHVKTYDGSPANAIDELPQDHGHPWIRLSTLVIINEFYAFGEVVDQDDHLVRVCLRDSGGLVLEDTVKNDIVVFQAHQQPILPLQLELYNDSDTRVRRQTVTF